MEDKIEKFLNCQSESLSYGEVRYVSDIEEGLETFYEWCCHICRTKVTIPAAGFRQRHLRNDPVVY